jgi:hypothetical protein
MSKKYIKKLTDLTAIQAELYVLERTSPNLSTRHIYNRERIEGAGILFLIPPSHEEIETFQRPIGLHRLP